MKNTIILFLIALLCWSCSDMDDNLKIQTIKPDYENIIEQDALLFTQIKQITTHDDNPLQEIVCLDFVYPLTLIIYDANATPVSQNIIIGDESFSAFLGALPANYSISISYPIQTLLADGTTFSVTNNAELKLAIDSCSKEDIILYCNGLFCPPTACVWDVVYTAENGSNDFVSGVFKTNSDGTLTFSYNEIDYHGTWLFVFVNNELHINISLQNTAEIGQYWNIDAPVTIGIEQMSITTANGNITLQQTCEMSETFAIGDVGPNGGIVFFDKGSYSNGWRYIEMAPADNTLAEWGCAVSSISGAQSAAIGKGWYNSAIITKFHDGLADYYTDPAICNSANNGTVAAKNALIYANSDKKYWFLPSSEELLKMRENLFTAGLGNLNGKYWSSTEIDAEHAAVVNFQTGNIEPVPKIPGETVSTRAIHYF